jgi:hypothetical protein
LKPSQAKQLIRNLYERQKREEALIWRGWGTERGVEGPVPYVV